jgi:hypothetical protein
MIQFPPTKNTILTTPERNCLPDFLRGTGSITPHRTSSGIHRLLPGTLHEARIQDLFHPESPFSRDRDQRVSALEFVVEGRYRARTPLASGLN